MRADCGHAVANGPSQSGTIWPIDRAPPKLTRWLFAQLSANTNNSPTVLNREAKPQTARHASRASVMTVGSSSESKQMPIQKSPKAFDVAARRAKRLQEAEERRKNKAASDDDDITDDGKESVLSDDALSAMLKVVVVPWIGD